MADESGRVVMFVDLTRSDLEDILVISQADDLDEIDELPNGHQRVERGHGSEAELGEASGRDDPTLLRTADPLAEPAEGAQAPSQGRGARSEEDLVLHVLQTI